MITYSAADQEWFNRNVPNPFDTMEWGSAQDAGPLTISPAELVYLSEQSDIAHDLAQLDAMCAKPAPRYVPDQREPMARLHAQQQVQRIKHYGPPQGRTIPVSTVAFILICGLFFAGVLLIELVGKSVQ